MAAVAWCYIPAPGTHQLLSNSSPPSLPLQTPLMWLQTVLPFLHPNQRQVAGNEKPVHWPIRAQGKRKKGGVVSSRLCLSLAGNKNPMAFDSWMLWAGDPHADALRLGARSEAQASLLSEGSSLSCVATSVCKATAHEIGANCP